MSKGLLITFVFGTAYVLHKEILVLIYKLIKAVWI